MSISSLENTNHTLLMKAKIPESVTIKSSKYRYLCNVELKKKRTKKINCQNVYRNLAVLFKNFSTDEVVCIACQQ